NTAPTTQGLPGADIHVLPAWDKGLGAGVTVGVVDDGVQYTHPDIAPNYDAADSFDFDNNDPDPINAPGVAHGPAVAGLIAARGNNGVGIGGVAPQAKLAVLRLTDDVASDHQKANPLANHPSPVPVYSNR